MIGNVKKTFPAKTGMWKSKFCKLQSMSEVLKVHAACCVVSCKAVQILCTNII